ncbi:YbhB/YbcL family Raf kinase inhibitor-like protein (plasmid) [Rhizobium sp. CB3060]|uniref:YbhB/YbcL family Raf kinase inhibitor-like protein n=1 Tax=unclassified Rhizobium TaxID=2613769 RepID=UPI0021A493B9|nr:MULTISPECIES: YbhB/YbcL family Raf kinase inhibitor-like protein [Rhizobium]MDK4741061.1 YbhB/YbcL family Raf kinase inhibitor-like protein [Rhizobium sp. CNPSo 3464]UWU24933.1 YbhB/YbcL family Raf kinase inhibitor-like protein [Rhizobium tropici]
MALTLISKAFVQDQPIPRKYARAGENLFPPLAWSGAPNGTRSFALIVEDPDAPSGTFHHCGIANIPAQWTDLTESADTAPDRATRFYRNDFGNARYDGPQPPPGDRPHHYIFRLVALDVPRLSIPDAAGIGAMWAEAKKHVLAEASVTGTYQTQ